MFENISLVAWIALLAGLLVLVFAGLVWLNRQAIKHGTHPLIKQFLAQAIIQAYKLSDMVFDATEERLHSVQKKEVAASVYEFLPDTIPLLGFQLNWKKLVSKEQFVEYVAAAYDEFVESFRAVKNYILETMIEEIQNNKPQKALKK